MEAINPSRSLTGEEPDWRASRPDKKALIVLMPWATPEFPGLGPTTIRTVVEAAGLPCDILYANLVFSRLNGGDPFVEKQLSKLAVSEIAFTPYYFGSDRDSCAEYFRTYASAISGDPEGQSLERYRKVVDVAGECLDELADEVDWSSYDVVGFSVMMQQTVSSLALAKRIKQINPALKIVFGGPSVSYPMGDEMIRRFPEIDVVIEGEADGLIVPTIEWLRGRGAPPKLPGILYRDSAGEIACTGRGGPFNKLAELPTPDFAPFFEQLERHGLSHVEPYLSIETSRGCWWGQKHHCTFCGIDDMLITYRSKSDEQVVREIVALSGEHRRTEFFVVDSIINHRFFNSVLPALARLRDEEDMDFTFFFESKSNLKRPQVKAMRDAGVNSVQPGIESFSDHILTLMDKGSTGIRQLQCLKLLAEQDISINWNLIMRNPGETVADYEAMLEMIPFMHHLPPTHVEGVIPMQINRFAPYHERPGDYGIKQIRPKPYMSAIFPSEDIDLQRISFYFDYDADGIDDPEIDEMRLRLRRAVEAWADHYELDSLVQKKGPGFVQIVDRRREPGSPEGEAPAERVTILESPWDEILSYCDEIRTQDQLRRHFDGRVEAGAIDDFVEDMIEGRFIYRSATGELISLPLMRVLEAR